MMTTRKSESDISKRPLAVFSGSQTNCGYGWMMMLELVDVLVVTVLVVDMAVTE